MTTGQKKGALTPKIHNVHMSSLILFSISPTFAAINSLTIVYFDTPHRTALDVILYSATFAGMKLAGVILIAIGFFLVMFPENWPDYITRLLR